MPCCDAMLPKNDVITVTSDQTVAEALALFEKKEIRSVPVLDREGALIGIFNFSHLLQSILPFMAIDDGTEDDDDNDNMRRLRHMEISLDHLSGSAPWIAHRLGDLLPKTLGEVMVKDPHFVHEDTALREGVRLIVKYGSPLPVIDKDNKKLVGIITSQKPVTAFAKIADDLAKGHDVNE
jgi:CBS domain-containing protein